MADSFESSSHSRQEPFGALRVATAPTRLDSLFPNDPENDAVTSEALSAYMTAMLEMCQRTDSQMALLHISVDDSPLVRFVGLEGSHLIAKVIVRGLKEQTRIYDVIGRLESRDEMGFPIIAVVCPLSDEEGATGVAKRLCDSLYYLDSDHGKVWLSVSCGVAVSAWDMQDTKALSQRAEQARLDAQERGGGCVSRYSLLEDS